MTTQELQQRSRMVGRVRLARALEGLLAVALIVCGLWYVYPPAALIAGGLALYVDASRK